MKNMKFVLALTASIFVSATLLAQTAQKGATVTNKGASIKSSTGSGVAAKKGEATVKSANGGGTVVNNKGAEAKNRNGAGVAAKKGEVSAKSSSGKGLEINKKHLQIKSKNVNIKLGK
jgi:hypothetical protein